MDANGWEIEALQELIELFCSCYRFDKNANLIKFQRVQQIIKLLVFDILGQLDIVLLKPVQG
jgi:hypothetical protein